MAEFSGSSIVPSDIGRVDNGERVSPSLGISQTLPKIAWDQLLRHHLTSHRGTYADVASRDDVGLDSEQTKHIRLLQIHSFTYVCSLFTALDIPTFHDLAVAHSCPSVPLDSIVLLGFL
ncbi:hypothetical protein TNCV_1903301 [Trichonephila clavipes]|nr:hypothetical protein TNCV_1903301 [Trichonephila clavipes]